MNSEVVTNSSIQLGIFHLQIQMMIETFNLLKERHFLHAVQCKIYNA